MTRRSRTPACLISVGIALFSLSAGAQTTGSIKGRVTDEATGAALPGVTVTVTGPALQGEQTEFTDDAGAYIVTELPPGEYLVRFYFANIIAERPDIALRAEQTLSLNVAMRTQEAETQTYTITERAPTVDVGSTQVLTQVTSEIVRNAPIRGRTYESVLNLAPGATADPVGPSFNGATGAENNYLLDGLNTTGVAYGLIGTPLTLEFLEETDVITAGYRAEYGRSTGGVISLVTKSGSNEMRGSVWFNTQPVLLEPNRIARTGEAVSSIRRRTDLGNDFGFELGGPVIKDWVWFYTGIAPNVVVDRYRRILRTRLAEKIPAGQTGSYLGDLDTDATCPDYIAGRDSLGQNSPLCVGPGVRADDPRPPGGFLTRDIPGSEREFRSESRLINYIGRLDFRLSDDHRASLSYVGSPSTFKGVFDNVRNPFSLGGFGGFNEDPDNMLFNETISVHDVVGRVISKLLDRKLQIEVRGGFHSQFDEVEPQARAAGSVLDTREVPLTTFEDVDECAVREVGGLLFNPCPVSNYIYGGFGFANVLTEQRGTIALDATYFAEAGGTHALKLGGDLETVRFKNDRGYSGGPRGGLFDVLDLAGGAAVDRLQFGTIDEETGAVVLTPEGYVSDTRTLNEAVYLQDSYSTAFVPGLTIDLGLRWEIQNLKDVDGKTRIQISDNISPRLGVIYDWTQRGLSKVFANYGRFYESIPLGVNDRALSKEGLIYQLLFPTDPGYCRSNDDGRVDPNTCVFPDPAREDAFGGELAIIQPNLKGQYSDQFAAGVEYDVGLDLVLGASYIHRELGRVIEDISPDGGNTYVVANPGDETDPGVVRDLQAKIQDANRRLAATSNPTVIAEIQDEKAKAINLLTNYQDIASFPRPTRTYNAAVFTARKRLTRNFLVLASYAFSRTIGNYPGLFQDSNGQLDPNLSQQFDLKDLLLNRDGPLPSDRPHNLKLLGSYFFRAGPTESDGFTIGLQFNALSGKPIEVLGRHPVYGASRETFILPRGAAGRTPWLTSLDLHLGYATGLLEGYKIEASLDVFNVLNQQGITSVDTEYTADPVDAIINGRPADLVNLRNVDGVPALKNPNYGQPIAYQAPLAMRFGARISF